MAFRLEDGTGVATANSYGSTSEADTYHADRGNTKWSEATTGAKQSALVQATDYIESHKVKNEGSPLTSGQALKFPRKEDKNSNGDGFVPVGIKRACYEYALEVIKGTTLQPTPDYSDQRIQSTKRKIGSIEKEDRYSTFGNVRTKALFPKADSLLRPFIVSANRSYR